MVLMFSVVFYRQQHRDGGYSTQAKRAHHLMLIANQLQLAFVKMLSLIAMLPGGAIIAIT